MEETSNNKFENLELSATTVSSAVTECNNNYYDLSNKVGNKLTYIDATGIYTGTIAAEKIVGGYINAEHINADELLSNGEKWALKSDGSGYLASKNITWDSEGNLSLKLGTRKQFKTIEIDDYESTTFILDLTEGYNIIFTKNSDNNDRTIQLPTDLTLDGIDVELILKGNPGYVNFTTNKYNAIRYNSAFVDTIKCGQRDMRIKLAFRKESYDRYCEPCIENTDAFQLYNRQSGNKWEYCENKYYNS